MKIDSILFKGSRLLSVGDTVYINTYRDTYLEGKVTGIYPQRPLQIEVKISTYNWTQTFDKEGRDYNKIVKLFTDRPAKTSASTTTYTGRQTYTPTILDHILVEGVEKKVGDKIWCVYNGWGEITSLDTGIWGIKCKFGSKSDTYNKDLKRISTDNFTSLYNEEKPFIVNGKELMEDKCVTDNRKITNEIKL
jgi:hypothetical protein